MGKMKELAMEERNASPMSPSPDEIWWMENERPYIEDEFQAE